MKLVASFRNHVDQVLRTYAFSRTVAASVALFSINDDLAVFKLHCILLADLDTITDAAAAALTFSALKSCF